MINMTAKSLISHSARIAWKDLTELFRNRLGLVLLIVMPLFMMVMVGFIYPSGNVTPNSMPFGLVNQDSGFNNSTIPSQTFITGFQMMNNQTHMLTLSTSSSIADIKSEIQKGTIDGAVVIPSNFSASVMSGEQGTLIVITDQSNPTVSAELQAAVSAEINSLGTQLAEQRVQSLSSNVTANNSLAVVQPYTVPAPASTSYFSFIAPGMVMLTVMMSVMTGLPVAISQEREVRHNGRHDGCSNQPVINHIGKSFRPDWPWVNPRRHSNGFGSRAIRRCDTWKHSSRGCFAAARRILIRWLRHRFDVSREGSGNSADDDDDTDVPNDVPQRCDVPTAADAMVHAGHSKIPSVNICC